MKTLSVVTFLLIVPILCWGQEQIQKGTYSLSGSLSYSSSNSSSKDGTGKSSLFAISPSATYFVADQFELIGTVSFSSYSYGYSSSSFSSSTTSNLITVQAGVRYYVPAGSIAPFFGGSYGISKITSSPSSGSPTMTSYLLQAGFDYFFVRTVALEPSIQYTGISQDDIKVHGIAFSVGFKYFIF